MYTIHHGQSPLSSLSERTG